MRRQQCKQIRALTLPIVGVVDRSPSLARVRSGGLASGAHENGRPGRGCFPASATCPPLWPVLGNLAALPKTGWLEYFRPLPRRRRRCRLKRRAHHSGGGGCARSPRGWLRSVPQGKGLRTVELVVMTPRAGILFPVSIAYALHRPTDGSWQHAIARRRGSRRLLWVWLAGQRWRFAAPRWARRARCPTAAEMLQVRQPADRDAPELVTIQAPAEVSRCL